MFTCFCSHTLCSLIRVAYSVRALVVTLRTCYGVLQIVVLLLVVVVLCSIRSVWTNTITNQTLLLHPFNILEYANGINACMKRQLTF